MPVKKNITTILSDMKFIIKNHDFKYETEKVCRLFMPFEKFEFLADGDENEGVYTAVEVNNEIATLTVSVNTGEKCEKREETIPQSLPQFENACELKLAQMLYSCLSTLTDYRAEWGIVTGIRPVKLLRNLNEQEGCGSAKRVFSEDFYVSDEKFNLTEACLKKEEKIISLSRPDNYSLYVSIPFCPSRCNYCSFVSHSVEKAKKLIPEYLDVLCEEIKTTAEIANKLGLTLSTVYIGGGTPTSLSHTELEKLMKVIAENFPIASALEYTVEAGRPDTITREKLEVIKKYGATRISINPQTMNDSVLEAIGRRHTSEETVKAFYLAREVGFDNINMDLIAGLTSDTVESFSATVDKLLELDPENITIHTLSMKRASNMTKASMFYGIEEGKAVSKMLSYAGEKLNGAGLLPYYMYRQNKTVGNLENVGYSKEGYEGLYNIYIMDETHTILACGASAVTKLKNAYTGNIERIFNYKYPYEYINMYDELVKRKDKIFEFYQDYKIN